MASTKTLLALCALALLLTTALAIEYVPQLHDAVFRGAS
jgi:hypothetical protein